jgi:hypothetical protein
MTIADRVAIHAAFAGVEESRVVFFRVHGSPPDRTPFIYIVECDWPNVYTVYNHGDLSGGLCPIIDLRLEEVV